MVINYKNRVIGGVKIPNRVTIALDDETSFLVKRMKEELEISQSELFRKSLKFFNKYSKIFDEESISNDKVNTYIEMLSTGEHIILDIDHFFSFLNFIEKAPNNEKFWKNHKIIGKAHAEEFSDKIEINSVEEVIKRLELCNFFKMIKDSSNRYTLLLGSQVSKTFIKMFLEEVLSGMGFKFKIKEGVAKLKIILENTTY